MQVVHRLKGLSIAATLCVVIGGACAPPMAAADPLPSWNDGPARTSIITFVEKVTDEGSAGFVSADERIATFDNDGTLWSEQPLYFQVIFALDRVKEMAAEHPEWKTTEPFQSALARDMKGLMAQGEKAVFEVLLASHANMTAEAFAQSVQDWLATAKHPTKGVPYTDLVYQPMLELLSYLRANGFKTFIVSGGGIDFMRVFTEKVYGVPPEQVVGSNVGASFEMRSGVPEIVKTDTLEFVDDKAGKPVGIYQHIGRRPIFAGGNSDGDIEMLQYTTIAHSSKDTTPRFGLIVHHTDSTREWAYDRDSHIGRLDKGLDDAEQYGWLVVDMKSDWKRIYPGKER